MRQIPMLDLAREYEHMKADIDAAIARCLSHQQWILGPEVREMEALAQSYLGAKHCVGASSGTDALVLALRALAIKTRGREFFDKTDEILTTPFTFTATGDAILRAGATPVFVDVDAGTFNIDLELVRRYLSGRDRGNVVGIIPVHLYGQACDMEAVGRISAEHNLFVLEDVAQAFGGAWKGKKLGTLGTAGAYSFFPSKNLGGFGDGGMVSTNDDDVARLTRMLLKHGGEDKYNVDHVGYNARLDTIQAAVLLAKFKHLDSFNDKRRAVAERYSAGLKGVKNLRTPAVLPNALHVWHQYTVRVGGGKRDALQKHLKECGIATMVYYPVPLHRMKVFNGRSRKGSDLAVSDAVSDDVLSLPIEPLQDEKTTDSVIGAIVDYFKRS